MTKGKNLDHRMSRISGDAFESQRQKISEFVEQVS